MQNILKTISILTFVALGAFTLATGAKANLDAKNLGAENSAIESFDATKDLYIRNCARCHGADGAGQTELGQKLDVPDLTISGRRMSVGKIARIVANGEDEMPAFGKKLSKKQIASISSYVRKL